MLRRDADAGAASGCPPPHPAPHIPSKPVPGAPDKTPEIIQWKGVEYIHLTRVHLLRAQPACSTRFAHVCPGDSSGGCAQAEPHRQGAPRVCSSATRVCLPTPEPLSSPTASEEGMKPGVWARMKSCTIFCRRCVRAQYEPTNTYV